MGRPKGSKNKTKEIETEEIYEGYFLMDSGLKIPVNILKEEGGKSFEALADCEWPFEETDIIWLGELSDVNIRAKRVVGFYIYESKTKV